MNLKSSSNLKLLVILGLVCLLTMFIYWYIYQYIRNDPLVESLTNPQFQWPPGLSSYEVVGNSRGFEELWRASDIFIAANDSGSNLVVLDDGLFFVGSITQNDYPILQKVNVRTGERDWQYQYMGNVPLLILSNQRNIVLGSGIPSKVTIFNAQSGNIVSQSSFSITTRGVEYILSEGDELYVNVVPANFYLVDENSGDIKTFENPNEAYPVFLKKDKFIYHRELSNRLQASDEQNGSKIWMIELAGEIIQIPVFTDDLIIVRTGRVSGPIYAIDQITGRILWDFQSGVVSNIAVADNKAYFLTETSRLSVINIQTGELISEIEFYPSVLELDDFDLVNRKFYVAAAENIVAVYFGSSRQLFTFQSTLKE